MTPVLTIVGASGSGKTTLMERLIPELRSQALVVAAIKHTHHDVDLEEPHKDSWRFREAGAERVILVTRRWRFTVEPMPEPPDLGELVATAGLGVDLVLIEGFKRFELPAIEVWRSAVSERPQRAADDPRLLALVTEEEPPADWRAVPRLPPEDTAGIANRIRAWRDAGRLRV
ncbi:MAG: molybdopterin-guanine dinucleotide biosynthesis protein B [Planctomycetota bacterium]